MSIKLALAGNPNCGKTTMFNALTGASQHVGNWPGVTVEKKEGHLKGDKEVVITDLPGIYSLSPYTLEEVVARTYLVEERPDGIINIVDATNIERNLYLTTQLVEMGIPVVVALNMMDLADKNGDKIDAGKLAKALGCPVIAVSALKNKGLDRLMEEAKKAAQAGRAPARLTYGPEVEEALSAIGGAAADVLPKGLERWYAVKLFERDEKLLEKMAMSADLRDNLEGAIAVCEAALEDDAESVITNERYEQIARIVSGCVKKGRTGLSVSDRIDRVVTNRILALPVFAAVMVLIYSIAMGTSVTDGGIGIGTFGTDWANDVLFGELVPGFFDSFLLNAAGEPVVAAWLYDLIQNGIVAGVGAVLGFVPQILVLCLLLAILEDVGYMARVAFVMDRIFRHFGLSGKSFIPLLVATGCGVPGIMASRTIEQDRDRKMTIMTTGFIPCGAKMPIIGLFAGAIFGGSALVAASAFFIGIAAVVISGIMLKKFKAFAGEPAPFVMELPPYHLPSAGNVLRATWERGWSFIKRAGTVILISSIVLWFLMGYGFENGVFGAVSDGNHSLLAGVGSAAAVIFYPLGWVGEHAWKLACATITGLIAKEEVVNFFGIAFEYAGEADLMEDASGLYPAIAAAFTGLSAYSFMIFNLLCAPCFAAMGAIKREMNNWKWTAAAIGYMCVFAYVVSMIVYQLGGLITGEVTFGALPVIAILLLAGIVYLLVRRGSQGETERLLAVDAARV